MFVLLFAEAPQALKSLFCYLRKLRKCQKVCFTICGSSASAKKFVLLFAEAPQALECLLCYLRKLRKHPALFVLELAEQKHLLNI